MQFENRIEATSKRLALQQREVGHKPKANFHSQWANITVSL